MPDKLTDNEIKKALECCIGDTDGKDCVSCPLYAIDECQDELNLATLNLINYLQAKNLNLTSDLTSLQNDLTSLQAENERLQKAIAVIDIMEDQHQYSLRKAKAEAYKEFAERLKEKYKKHFSSEWSAVYNTINNLLKEKIGE